MNKMVVVFVLILVILSGAGVYFINTYGPSHAGLHAIKNISSSGTQQSVQLSNNTESAMNSEAVPSDSEAVQSNNSEVVMNSGLVSDSEALVNESGEEVVE